MKLRNSDALKKLDIILILIFPDAGYLIAKENEVFLGVRELLSFDAIICAKVFSLMISEFFPELAGSCSSPSEKAEFLSRFA